MTLRVHCRGLPCNYMACNLLYYAHRLVWRVSLCLQQDLKVKAAAAVEMQVGLNATYVNLSAAGKSAPCQVT